MRRAASLTLLALAACRPPATDGYVERVPLDGARAQQHEPIASPDTEGAIWAGGGPARIVYGKPGKTPFFALACAGHGPARTVHAIRFVAADPGAKALMAMVGNGHISRLKVDAERNGKVWLWEGHYAPDDPRLDVLTGPRKVEVTVPGAGTLELNLSPRPRELIERCRRLSEPEEPAQEPEAQIGEPAGPA